MGKLICLLGKSGAGKDTLFRNILAEETAGLIPVIPCTTRPKRANETQGIHYNFVTESQMRALEAEGKIIEMREYYTTKGIWYYFTLKIEISGEADFIIITTPAALETLSQYYGRENIIVVFLTTDPKVRLLRSISRESKEKKPDYSEICRRFLADEEDFAKIDLKGYHASFEIDTDREMQECVNSFMRMIKK